MHTEKIILPKDFVEPNRLYNFSRIPCTISNILSDEIKEAVLPKKVFGKLPTKYRNVILFFVDGFGWDAYQKYVKEFNLLEIDKINVTEISAQFPSTTASNLTTLHTGLSVEEHGIFEWLQYEPLVDKMIYPVKFNYLENYKEKSLAQIIDPGKIFNFPTLYEKLKGKEVSSFTFMPKQYASTPYSSSMLSGSMVVPYEKLELGFKALFDNLKRSTEKNYYFFYYSEIDNVAHRYGPKSREFYKAIKMFFSTLQSMLYKYGSFGESLFIITSDHGQIDIDPSLETYIELELPQLSEFMKKDREGNLLVPGGGCRDMFLYINEDQLYKAKEYIVRNIKRNMEVYTIDELIMGNIFDKRKISKRFLDRVGNLIILPRENNNIWFSDNIRKNKILYGHHGGLTQFESKVPFLTFVV